MELIIKKKRVADLDYFVDGDGRKIEWQFIAKLHGIQMISKG